MKSLQCFLSIELRPFVRLDGLLLLISFTLVKSKQTSYANHIKQMCLKNRKGKPLTNKALKNWKQHSATRFKRFATVLMTRKHECCVAFLYSKKASPASKWTQEQNPRATVSYASLCSIAWVWVSVLSGCVPLARTGSQEMVWNCKYWQQSVGALHACYKFE